MKTLILARNLQQAVDYVRLSLGLDFHKHYQYIKSVNQLLGKRNQEILALPGWHIEHMDRVSLYDIIKKNNLKLKEIEGYTKNLRDRYV